MRMIIKIMKERKLMIHSSNSVKNQRMKLCLGPAQNTKEMIQMKKNILISTSQVKKQMILLLILTLTLNQKMQRV